MARKVKTTAIAVEPKRQYPGGGGLFAEISGMIDAAKRRAAAHVNAELTMLYWNVGKRINEEVLHGGKAQYGKQIVVELAERLTAAFGDGWKLRQLFYCMRLAEVYPDPKILHTLCAKLAWSHIRLLISIEEPLKREFYIEMCKIERWSVRELQGRINSMMFERTAIASKPEAVIRHDLVELRREGAAALTRRTRHSPEGAKSIIDGGKRHREAAIRTEGSGVSPLQGLAAQSGGTPLPPGQNTVAPSGLEQLFMRYRGLRAPLRGFAYPRLEYLSPLRGSCAAKAAPHLTHCGLHIALESVRARLAYREEAEQ